MAAIKQRGPERIEPTVVPTQAPRSGGGAGCRWLMLAAEMAGLTSGNWRSPPDSAPRGRARLPRIATRTPGTDAGSVRAARDFTVATLHRWGVAERSEDIAIVMSELLTNALRHAVPGRGDTRPWRPIRLGLLQPGPCVLCAVADPDKAAPVPQTHGSLAEAGTHGSLAETGRGLHIICALSDKWGYMTLSDTGKVVWAAFSLAPDLVPVRPAAEQAGGRPGVGSDSAVSVGATRADLADAG